MPKSHRILTELGVDKSVEIQLDQDFDFLEILSLKITQSEIYARMCADYGVVVGRVIANSGYGIPNAKVSVFVPLSDQDEENPVISTLYPYKTLTDKNADGYRYNLLPYIQSYSNHVPTGTFPSREDALINTAIIEVYDKYYKYTAKTNDSGDFMIFGVPVGGQVIVMDLDLSDMGEFSLSPQDLIRMGIATENQVNGIQFRSSTNLDSLPQLINVSKEIEVLPFWGQPEICQFAITREDFDLVKEVNLDIQPTAIFMGSIISTIDRDVVKRNCKPKLRSGQLCRLTTGPGEILSIRQTIFIDNVGYPILEQYVLEEGGKVIDDNGTWLVDLPMNLDYYITDQFGNKVLSNDPRVGIPTKAKYRFKVKWQQSPEVYDEIKRGYFLIPNIREYGWSNPSNDPYTSGGGNLQDLQKSYAFSLDWNDYVDPQSAINCDDTFYEFKYNKVYTISQLITQYRNGTLGSRFIGIKNIMDDACDSENTPFPTNDSNFRFDILFLLFMLLMNILKPILFVLLIIAHVLSFLLIIIVPILQIIATVIFFIVQTICKVIRWIIGAVNKIPGVNLSKPNCPDSGDLKKMLRQLEDLKKIFTNLKLPMLSFPDCELCSCTLSVTPLNSSDVIGEPRVPPPNGLLYPFQFPLVYEAHDEDDSEQSTWWGHMHAGMNGITKKRDPAVGSIERIPGYFGPYGWSTDRGFFTTSIPIPELINLFNLKAKYFNNDNNDTPSAVPNAGLFTSTGGWNQIKVAVNPNANNASTANPFIGTHHYDKPLIIITDNITFKSGAVLTFQNPTLSKDVHLTGGSFNDVFGINTVTGTVINTNTVSIDYADPTNQYNPTPNNVIYNVSQSGETIDNVNSGIQFHKFATDLEYYQVITAITYDNFYNTYNRDSNGDFPPYSFLGRIEGNRLIYSTSGSNPCLLNVLIVDQRPIASATDIKNAQVHILFRGVDPYSTRQETHVDLSRIFGYDYGSGPVISGNFKLNWPIQPSLKLPDHYYQSDNSSSAGQAGDSTPTSYLNRYFFRSLSYDPGVDSGGTSLWSAYTTNMHCYYSNCNVNWTGTTAINNNLGVNTVTIGFNVPPPNVTTGPDGEFRIHPNNLYCYYFPMLGGLYGTEGWPSLLAASYTALTTNRKYLEGYCSYNSNVDPKRLYWGINLFPTGGYDPNADRIYYSDSTNYQAVFPTVFTRDYGGRGKGYWSDTTKTFGEYIEGGSGMVARLSYSYRGDSNQFNPPDFKTFIEKNKLNADYHSFIYTSGLSLNMIDKQNIVMRSERLPSSTVVEKSSLKYTTAYTYQNDYVLHQNAYFNAFEIGDDGSVSSFGAQSSGGFNFQQQEAFTANTIDKALDSFSCGKMYPLECYKYKSSDNTIEVGPGTSNYPDCIKSDGKEIFVAGSCYNLVTKPILSLIVDFKLLTEWTSRIIINFGACRDVWSHLFVNNWINGTLYAFAFRNDVFYSGTSTSNPSINFCREVIFFDDKTNNFYYRSSPYNQNNNEFIGSKRPSLVPTRGPGNIKNLLYPTTILDMGPRNDYLNQLNFNSDYDGYYLTNMKSTTFGDPSELLNYFILSRMISTKFLAQLFSSQGANIFSYFTRYGKSVPRNMMVDGDYAQLISINSELGVAPFEPENYPDPPSGQPPVYYNGGDAGDAVIGVFYSSDTQLRDYITPRRKLINPTDPVPALGAFPSTNDFYYINTKSQEVPYYKWKMDQLLPGNPTPNIFGKQSNDWYTPPLPTPFFKYKYQELDRLVYPDSSVAPFPEQYMMSKNTSRMDYYKGYIYAVNNAGTSAGLSSDPNEIFVAQTTPNAYLVGVPYQFYFGLKQGKSAFNRFFTKWVKPEVIT